MRNSISASQEGSGEREKRLVALSSVLAAIFMTSMNLTVGLLTGSLGILSEAAHNGLDLFAAAITFFAVRASGRPADEEHHYGHGKIENFSALAETLLLFVTCAWIVYEAVERLFFRSVHIEVTAWSFIVMVVAIIIDVTRSRALKRAARKYHSQALEADALHFSTDVWSSSVVIMGLIGVFLGQSVQATSPALATWLYRADAVAALGVSAIVVYVSWRLGRRTVLMLLDSAPKGLTRQVKETVAHLTDVSEVRSVRVRQSGPTTFVDMTVVVPSYRTFEDAHEVSEHVEEEVRRLVPRCDVVVHMQPAGSRERDLLHRARRVAARQGVDIHDLYVRDTQSGSSLELHIEVPPNLTVGEAHERASQLERALAESLNVHDIVVHIDPVGDATARRSTRPVAAAEVQDVITEVSRTLDDIKGCHSITVLREGDNLSISLHCLVSPDWSVDRAHELSDQFESLLRERLHRVRRVTIHLEPTGEDEQRPA